nr:hypothetical protein [Tanacetum cinerariifolium]
MNKKNYSFDLETFRDMLQICPNLPSQKFVDPLFEEEILAFIRKLAYSKNMKSLSDAKVKTLPQPWRTFRTIINKFLSDKVTGNDLLRLSQAQILWGKRLKATTKVAKSGKKKLPAQGLETLSKIALSKAEQMKVVTKRSKTDYHVSHASGLGAHEGTGVTPGVLDVPTYGSKDEQISWKSNDDEVSENADNEDDDDHDDDNANIDDDNGQDDDNEQTESENYGDDFVHPNLFTLDEEERHKEKMDEEEEEKLDEEKTNEEEEVNELYKDVNINLEGRYTEMTDALLDNVQATQVIEDTHVIMTVVTPEVQQQSSSVSSGFISKKLNSNPDTGIDSILNLNIESTSLVDVPVITNDEIHHSSI